MNQTSFLSKKELIALGLKKCGSNVKISRKACLYGAENISIGTNVRVDDFCILSGNITICNNVHIAAYSALYGASEGIEICDFANISSRVCIYAISDDFSGMSMTNPTIPNEYKLIYEKHVLIEKHAIIGSGSTILPGVKIAEGCAIGAMTLCKKNTLPWSIYAGIPARKIKNRQKKLLEYEQIYKNIFDENY